MYSSDELFLRSLECYFCVKHKNDPLVSDETVRHSSAYIILYVVVISHVNIFIVTNLLHSTASWKFALEFSCQLLICSPWLVGSLLELTDRQFAVNLPLQLVAICSIEASNNWSCVQLKLWQITDRIYIYIYIYILLQLQPRYPWSLPCSILYRH